SGDASFKYLSYSRLNRYSDYLLVTVHVENEPQVLKHLAFTQEAEKLYRTDPIQFRRTYGNQFVAGLRTGGEFTAILRAESSTDSEQQEVRATLSVVAGAYGQGDAAFKAAMSKLSTLRSTKVDILRTGTAASLPTLDVSSLITYA